MHTFTTTSTPTCTTTFSYLHSTYISNTPTFAYEMKLIYILIKLAIVQDSVGMQMMIHLAHGLNLTAIQLMHLPSLANVLTIIAYILTLAISNSMI